MVIVMISFGPWERIANKCLRITCEIVTCSLQQEYHIRIDRQTLNFDSDRNMEDQGLSALGVYEEQCMVTQCMTVIHILIIGASSQFG